MDRYLSYLTNEILIIIIVLLTSIIVINPIYQMLEGPYCIESSREVIYEGVYGYITRYYWVVERC